MDKDKLKQKCEIDLIPKLRKRGVENPEQMASQMCGMWARKTENPEHNDVPGTMEETKRNFAIVREEPAILQPYYEEGTETWKIPVIALTCGVHTYEEDGEERKVYIEPHTLEKAVENFNGMPAYYTHQRTPEDLLGEFNGAEIVKLPDNKIGVKVIAEVTDDTPRKKEALKKIESGDITHVSPGWSSWDIQVMGETFATEIKPFEISFIDNEIADPICEPCIIGGVCETNIEDDTMSSDGDSGVPSATNAESTAAAKLMEREFAELKQDVEALKTEKAEVEATAEGYRKQLEEAQAELKKFADAEAERVKAQAEEKRASLVQTILNKEKEVLSLDEEKVEVRKAELSDWSDDKLDGRITALEEFPTPTEREFGKGKTGQHQENTDEGPKALIELPNGQFLVNPDVLPETP